MVDRATIELVTEYLAVIPKEIGIKRAFLFGFHSRGLQRSESDIDIALVVDGVTDMFNLQLQLMRLRRKIDLRIEPHPIDKHDFNSSNPLAYEIEKNGIELRIP